MEAQWPLIIFTLFVCLTCGTLAGMSLMALTKKGEALQFPGLILAAVSLVIGGIGSFLHLEHWERIFNGFGHITSGITQELIGCVVLAILMVVWFVVLRGKKPIPAVLAWITIILAVIMVVATAHSYMMQARPAWGFALIVFYLANAFLLGSVAIWGLSSVKKEAAIEESAVKMTLFAAIAQVVANLIYVGVAATATITDYGHYADPTRMTSPTMHVDSLLNVAVAGDGALLFWGSLICALIVLVCAVLARKKIGASQPLMIVSVLAVFIASLTFRVLIYVLGFSVFLLY